MLVVGVDAHKRTHTAVVVDGLGRQVGQRTVKALTADHLELLRWAERLGAERLWAVEDCRHVSRRLERDLLVAGERIVRVPPQLMAGARRQVRAAGKSDPIDALAVARAALREPDLPVAGLDGAAREVRLLVDHRDDQGEHQVRGWWANGPGSSTGCGGISTSSIRAGIRRRGHWTGTARWTGSRFVSTSTTGRWRASRGISPCGPER